MQGVWVQWVAINKMSCQRDVYAAAPAARIEWCYSFAIKHESSAALPFLNNKSWAKRWTAVIDNFTRCWK